MQPIEIPPGPPSMRYIFATQPWWMNVVLWSGRLALAGTFLTMLIPVGYTVWSISTGAPLSEKPDWMRGYNPVWIAMWFMQGMMWCFLAVALYRGLHGLPLLFKDEYIKAFSWNAAAIWSLLPLSLFLLPLQLEHADYIVLPDWLASAYTGAGLLNEYFGWLL